MVVHTPRHVTSLADLEAEELEGVAQAWKARADAARREGFAYLLALVNEGRAAGASRAHTHSQLVALREEPPVSSAERAGGACPVCAVVAVETHEGARVIADRGDLVLFCPWAGRAPYEMMVAPHEEHAPDAFADEGLLARALYLLADGLRRLRAVAGPVPLNAWVHTAPFGEEGHWHVEVVPRLNILAGLELGAGYWVNTVAPEAAAEALRQV